MVSSGTGVDGCWGVCEERVGFVRGVKLRRSTGGGVGDDGGSRRPPRVMNTYRRDRERLNGERRGGECAGAGGLPWWSGSGSNRVEVCFVGIAARRQVIPVISISPRRGDPSTRHTARKRVCFAVVKPTDPSWSISEGRPFYLVAWQCRQPLRPR